MNTDVLNTTEAKEILELIKEYIGDNDYWNILEVAEDILFKNSEIRRLYDENKILKQEILELKNKLKDFEAMKIKTFDVFDNIVDRVDAFKEELNLNKK